MHCRLNRALTTATHCRLNRALTTRHTGALEEGGLWLCLHMRLPSTMLICMQELRCDAGVFVMLVFL